jgi:methionine aminopeptidase
MTIQSQADLDGMRRVGRVVRDALEAMRRNVAPGVSTGELDVVCARTFDLHGAQAAPTRRPRSSTGSPARPASVSTTRLSTAFQARGD